MKKRKKLEVAKKRSIQYSEDFVHQALIACSELGANEHDLAKLFGVGRNTINNWKRKHQEFADAVQRGKDIWDTCRVEKSLLLRAVGFEYDEVTLEDTFIKKGKKRIPGIKRKVVRRFVPGDVQAILFWLQNRQPERWKNTKRFEFSGTVTNKNEQLFRLQVEQLKKLSRDDLEKLAEIITKARYTPARIGEGGSSGEIS